MPRQDDMQGQGRSDRPTSDIAREEAQRSGGDFASDRDPGESAGRSGIDRQEDQGGMSGSDRQRQQGDLSGPERERQQGGMSGSEREWQQGGMSGTDRERQQGNLSGSERSGTWTHGETEAGEQGRSNPEEDEELRNEQSFE